MDDIADPERFRMHELLQRYLEATNDSRKVVADPKAQYLGAEFEDNTLVPAGAAHLGKTGFAEWMTASWNVPH